MSKDAKIEISESNFDNIKESDIEQETIAIAGVEQEDLKIVTWKGDGTIFLLVNNVTIELKEEVFYQLTKVVEETTKKLLNIG